MHVLYNLTICIFALIGAFSCLREVLILYMSKTIEKSVGPGSPLYYHNAYLILLKPLFWVPDKTSDSGESLSPLPLMEEILLTMYENLRL